MKRIKLFEEFSVNEGMYSEINIIGQESETKEDFIRDVKAFLAKHAADPKIADDDAEIEKMAATYFDEEGNKI